MRVLVTGGLGAIGSYVTRLFHERGDDVVVFDLRPDLRLVRDIADAITVVQVTSASCPRSSKRSMRAGSRPSCTRRRSCPCR